MLKLIKQSLTVKTYKDSIQGKTEIGVIQGSPISPLYSNIYLNLIDQIWHKRKYDLLWKMHRFADDCARQTPRLKPAKVRSWELTMDPGSKSTRVIGQLIKLKRADKLPSNLVRGGNKSTGCSGGERKIQGSRQRIINGYS